jgi:predicted  nucleic acid-binding Zn-ribbon protein
MSLITKFNVKLDKDTLIKKGTSIDNKNENYKELKKLGALTEPTAEINGELTEQVKAITAEVERLKEDLETTLKEKADLEKDCTALTTEIDKLKKSK